MLLVQNCLDDGTGMDFRMLKITSIRKPKIVEPYYPYCSTCHKYLTSKGMTESPLEAARDLHTHKTLRDGGNIVAAEHFTGKY